MTGTTASLQRTTLLLKSINSSLQRFPKNWEEEECHMIRAVVCINRQGRVRLERFYELGARRALLGAIRTRSDSASGTAEKGSKRFS